MILFREAPLLNFNKVSLALCLFALAGFTTPLQAQLQAVALPSPGIQGSSTAPIAWHSDAAVHLIGLPEVKEKMKGSLSITSAALIFESSEGHASVDRAEISSVTVGDVRVETGGTAGKITRAIIPFGGGSALATVTNKQVSLLTIEFRDQRDALHGVVFLLPKDEAVLAQKELGSRVLPPPVEQTHELCEVRGGAFPDTIKVMAIETQGAPVPAEYKALVYEQLVRQLRAEGTFTAVYRDGDDDPAAACPRYGLVLTIDGFKKGNAALRASTGPVGFFVGATSLRFHVQLQGLNGAMVLDKELKASQRGDSDSLNIADKIAKSLTKDLKKASTQAART